MTDARYIREVQYKDPGNLKARQSIYVFQQPRVTLWSRIVELAELSGDERVLDVGCGNGLYLDAMARSGHRGLLVGADLSSGMLPEVRARAPQARLLVADAQRVPFPDNSFDRVLALHMLYHVPDRAAGLAEIRRVLRPDGVALVVTNSVEHLNELDVVIKEAMIEAGGAGIEPMRRSMERFSVESAPAELQKVFPYVEFVALHSQLRITQTEPVLAYVRSMRALLERSADADAICDGVRERVDAAIARDGEFVVRTRVGCFICR